MANWGIRRRIKNMVWNTADKEVKTKVTGATSYTDMETVTISDPEVLNASGFGYLQAEDMSLYASAHEGSHNKFTEKDALRHIMESTKAKDRKEVNDLCQVLEDYRVDTLATKQRPGYADLRRLGSEPIFNRISKLPVTNKWDKTTSLISYMTYGVDITDFVKNHSISNEDIAKAKRAVTEAKELIDNGATTSDMMNYGKKAYYNIFGHREEDDPPKMDDPDVPPSESGSDSSKPEDDKKSKSKGEGKGESKSKGDKGKAEKSKDKSDKEDKDKKDKTSDDTDDKDSESKEDGDKDSSDDGDSSDSSDSSSDDKEENKPLEKSDYEDKSVLDTLIKNKDLKETLDREKSRKKRDLHNEDAKHSSFSIDSKRAFDEFEGGKEIWTEQQKKERENIYAKDENLDCQVTMGRCKKSEAEYNKRTIMCEEIEARQVQQSISAMTNMLKDEIRKAEDEYITTSGKIKPDRIWRAEHSSNKAIFSKKEVDEAGGMVVDLILDASGSQGGRAYDIRKQSYIIAETMSNLGIPCRVVTFDNVGVYTRFILLRDYDEPRKANDGCFAYQALADNRDGFALSVLSYDDLNRPEENKIMIVLSDGEPADTQMHSSSSFRGLRIYTYEDGVEPTKKNIRKIRQQGIKLFGIYVGGRLSTLQMELQMYGNDFVTITEASSFATKVGNFLKTQFSKI